jgi:DNA-binding MarR family transcriptional regulator
MNYSTGNLLEAVRECPSDRMTTETRAQLIEETVGQMRRVITRAMASFGPSPRVGGLPLLPHMALHATMQRGGVTQSELAEFLGVSSAHVTGLVDQLESQGYVKRQRDAEDRRVIHVKATLHGRHRHVHAHTHAMRQGSILFDGWSEADIRTFKDFLSRMELPRRTRSDVRASRALRSVSTDG